MSVPRTSVHRLALPRTLPRLLAIAALAATTALITPTPAQAHSALRSSDPADGVLLPTAPTKVTLEFNEDVAPEFVDASLSIGTDPAVPLTTAADGPIVVVALPQSLATTAATQQWEVAYRVVSADGHPISGTVGFVIAAGTDTSQAPSQSPEATPETTPGDTPASAAPPAPSSETTPAASPPVDASPGGTSSGGTSSGGTSSLAWAVGLAAAAGTLAGTVVVLARRRRQS